MEYTVFTWMIGIGFTLLILGGVFVYFVVGETKKKYAKEIQDGKHRHI